MRPVVINYLAVFASTLAGFILGWIWYGPLFGKQWKALEGFTDEKMKAMKMSPVTAMVGGFITSFLMSFVLAHSIVFASAYFGMSGLSSGLMSGLWNWLGFVVPVSAGIVLWEGKSWTLLFLNLAYWLVSLLAMGTILCVWR